MIPLEHRIERPTLADPRPGGRTWLVIAAMYEAVAWLTGLPGVDDLPELVHLDALTGDRDVQVRAQLDAGLDDRDRAAAVIAWHAGVPGSTVSVTGHNAGQHGGYWRAVVHVPGELVELWSHLRGLTEAQAERLDRHPEAAHAVLVELAEAGR